MGVNSILPYFGSKRRLARDIVPQFGKHRTYWELCHGGLAILLSKRRSPDETVLDLNGHASNLAMVLASDRWRDLHDRLTRTLASERLFRCAQRVFKTENRPCPTSPAEVTDEHVERAYWYMIISWMGMQGTAGTARANYQFSCRYTASSGGGNSRWVGAVDKIPLWHQRLRGVVFLNRSLFVVLPRIEDERGVVIYADPPYFRDTRGSGGGSVYEFDFTLRDHVRLARELSRFKRARVVVSYYDHPYLDRLYRGWTKVPLEAWKTIQIQNGKSGRTKTPEVLLINGPSLTHSLFAEGGATC